MTKGDNPKRRGPAGTQSRMARSSNFIAFITVSAARHAAAAPKMKIKNARRT
jgi:hypothetical protein